jgi:flavin-binding protein dodecin
MSVVKVIELVGTSKKSWQDAVEDAIREASQTLRHITSVELVSQTAHVTDGRITEYRTKMNVGFVVEHHSHLVGVGSASAKKDV